MSTSSPCARFLVMALAIVGSILRSAAAEAQPAPAAATGDTVPSADAASSRTAPQSPPRVANTQPRSTKSPELAALLSVPCPGCGQFYLGQPFKGALFLGLAPGLVGGALGLQEYGESQPDLSGPEFRPALPTATLLRSAGLNGLWFYNVFDAYQSARLMRGDQGYRYPVARDTLGDLFSSGSGPRAWKIERRGSRNGRHVNRRRAFETTILRRGGLHEWSIFTPEWHSEARRVEPQIDRIMESVFDKYWRGYLELCRWPRHDGNDRAAGTASSDALLRSVRANTCHYDRE